MRGLAAHSNGFQTIRALAILMSLLGTIDRPGGFRHKAPFPRPIPPCAARPTVRGRQARHAAGRRRWAGPGPGRPVRGRRRQPVRIDKAFSWEHPLSVHGLMHNVITNAWRGDPYRIDTLLIFMANMAWNSTMNTVEVRKMLNDKEGEGEYKIPFLVVCDAFQSEMTAFADLILPDTTYLERHDVMSMLDRPISEFDGPVDSVRIPVVPPKGECKPFQEVLIELGTRLKLPAFTPKDGTRKFRDYPDFIVNYETEPGLRHRLSSPAGAARAARSSCAASPTRGSGRCTKRTTASSTMSCRKSYQYMRNWNQGYLEWRSAMGITALRRPDPDPPLLRGAAGLPPGRAGQGRAGSRRTHLRERIETYFDPLPFYYEPLEEQAPTPHKYPLAAITQRPMAMYHSWDSQNAWLRQIHTHNYLFVNPKHGAGSKASPTAAGCGSNPSGARCAACAATPRRWSPARSGPGTRSARQPAPGT
jgi:anaerobic selenocysteine-containing dehydrogenase